MGTTQEEPTLKELVSRLAELEQVYARLQEKLELSSETAPTAKPPRPGVFASDVAGTPAVSASGTNGADGVDATSASGTGISATSGSGTGLVATSSSGLAGHFVGNVSMSNNLAVVGMLSGGAAGFASSVAGTPAVKASGTTGADGMDASSDSGFGVRGDSNSGVGVTGTSQTGDGIHGFGSIGVLGQSNTGVGIQGLSDTGAGVAGSSNNTGVEGAGARIGVFAQSSSGLGVWAVGGGASPGTPPFGITETAVFAEGGPNPGIVATSSSGAGILATSSSGAGVSGQSDSGFGTRGDSNSGVGVIGTSQTGDGIHGFGSIGVRGQSDSGIGIDGASNSGIGVRGDSNSSSGVYGNSNSGNGVTGFSNSGSGVAGNSSSGRGVSASSSSGDGIFATSSSGLAGHFVGDVAVTGNFSVISGTKNFVQTHPTDPGREIVYVALEGGEAGTYVRGTGHLVNGKAVLELPEHFRLVTDTQGLTIHLTARGAWLQLYVVELDTAQIVVREAQGQSGAFDYLIHGVRRGYEQHEVIRTKR